MRRPWMGLWFSSSYLFGFNEILFAELLTIWDKYKWLETCFNENNLFSDIGKDEPFTEIPLERLENGLTANGDNMDTGLSIEASNGNSF